MGLWQSRWKVFKVYLLVQAAYLIKWVDLFKFVFEFPDVCAHPPLPDNQTGLKVVIAAISKAGTRTMNYGMNEIGVRSYHSDDVGFFSFVDYYRLERARRPGRNVGAMIRHYPDGKDSLGHSLSKCRVESLAFDGLERFFEPVVELSPGVKVLYLPKSFEAWKKSLAGFMGPLIACVTFDIIHTASLAMLPWAGLLRALDPLFDSPIACLLREGAPAVTHSMLPLPYMYYMMVNHRTHFSQWIEPMAGINPQTAEEYEEWDQKLKTAYNAARPEDRFMWDWKKHTFEDLCKFMGVSPCPRSGSIPRSVNSFPWQQDQPITGAVVTTVGVFFFWVNWRLFHGLFGCFTTRGGSEKKDK